MSIKVIKALSDDEIIDGCKKHQKKAQCMLYEKYAPLLMAVCLRYMGNVQEAEDILHDGFIKILSNIGQYRHEGSFEGWMKRIIVNTIMTYLKKSNRIRISSDTIYNSEVLADELENEINTENFRELILNAEFSEADIHQVINELQDDYKTVFNLYTFEDFKHKEIAELLHMTENTSRSKLLRARKLIQKRLVDLVKENKINTL